jgi:hypothetical protein
MPKGVQRSNKEKKKPKKDKGPAQPKTSAFTQPQIRQPGTDKAK